jgi:hypothetical protein
MQTWNNWRWLNAGATLAAMLFAVGCESLSPQPTPAAATMAGNWRVDAASSDDFDRKLAPLLQQVHRHEQPRPPMEGPPATGTGQGRIDPLVMPPEEPDKLRSRLGDDLRPAAALRIALLGDGVEITRDAEPTREFRPSQSVSRIDTSGAARLECGWDQGAFVIHAKYTTRGSRSWRLEHDAASDTLRVTFDSNNPEYGHLELHTLYRRTTDAPP